MLTKLVDYIKNIVAVILTVTGIIVLVKKLTEAKSVSDVLSDNLKSLNVIKELETNKEKIDQQLNEEERKRKELETNKESVILSNEELAEKLKNV